MANSPENKQKASKRYAKKPIWQWVLIYLVVAVVIYGLAYLIFFRGNGSTGGY